MKLAKDIAALNAVSKIIMHSNKSITDGVYGILSDNYVREQIAALSHINNSNEKTDIDELKSMTKKVLEKLGIN